MFNIDYIMENLNDPGAEIELKEGEELLNFEDVLEDVKKLGYDDNIEDVPKKLERSFGKEVLQDILEDSNNLAQKDPNKKVFEDAKVSDHTEPIGDAQGSSEKFDHIEGSKDVPKNINYFEHPEGFVEYPIDGPEDVKTYFFKKGVNHLGYYLKSKDKKNRNVKYKRY